MADPFVRCSRLLQQIPGETRLVMDYLHERLYIQDQGNLSTTQHGGPSHTFELNDIV